MDAQQSVKVEGQSDGTVNHMPHRVLRLKSIKQPEDLDTALPEEEQYGYDGQPTAYYWQEDRRSGDNDSYGGVSQRLQSARFPSPPHVQYRLSRIPSKNTSRAYAPSQNERTPLCFPHREDHHSTRRPIPSTSKTRPKRLANFPAQDAVRDRPHFTSQQRQSIYMQTDNTNAKPRTSFADDFAPRPGHDKFPENRRLRREQRLITHEPRVATGTLVPQAGPSDQNGAAQISYSDTPTPTSYPGDPRRETKAGRRLIRREERLIVHEAKVKLGLAGPLLYPPKRTDPPQTGDSHAAESNGTVAGTKKLGKYTMKRLRQVELRAEKRAEKKARAAAEGHPGGGERACDDYDRGSEWQEGYGYADNSERRGGRDRARSGGQERARSPLTRAWSPAPRVRSPHHFARSSAPATPTLSAWRRAFGTRRDDSGRRW
ncbi:hypothetical protein NX059_003012 [Plenodomus lindquistii]|nr:hypothetical protein NX059_003012 [Plenodomus lindquistii]